MEIADERIDGLLDVLSIGAIQKLAVLRQIARIASEEYVGADPEEIFRYMESTHYEKMNQLLTHNDRKNLKDLLWLIAFKDERVDVTQRNLPGNETQITCFEAFNATKHIINNAATELRQRFGAGRSSGGGRRKNLPRCATEGGLRAFLDEFEENKPWIIRSPEFMEMLERTVRSYRQSI